MSLFNRESIERNSENLKNNILDGVQNINGLIENMNKMQAEFEKIKSDMAQIHAHYRHLMQQEREKYAAMNQRIDNLVESVKQSNIVKDAKLREVLKQMISANDAFANSQRDNYIQIIERLQALEKRTGLR